MKILGCETHYKTPFQKKERTSAVDWWRVLSPLIYLKLNTDWHIDFTRNFNKPFDGATTQDYSTLNNYDILHASYFDNPLGFKEIYDRRHNVIHNIDFDDNIFSLSGYNPVKQQYEENPRAFKTLSLIVKEADHLSVTNRNLKKAYANMRTKPTGVVDNYIDLNVYSYQGRSKQSDKIVIGYQGGVTHFADLYRTPFWGALTYILGKYKDSVEFSVCGFIPDTDFQYLPNTKWQKGSSDFFEWIDVWKEWIQTIDIAVAPLEDTEFNSCKSSIKPLEYGANKVPVVASNVAPYKRVNKVLKAETMGDWIFHLEKLIDDENYRRKKGEVLYKHVKKDWSMDNNWHKWKEYFESLNRR